MPDHEEFCLQPKGMWCRAAAHGREFAQRARARNLVHWLRYKATLEFDVAMGLWSGVRVDDALKRSKSRKALADRIAAKYLGWKV
jgi:hypothetical protein